MGGPWKGILGWLTAWSCAAFAVGVQAAGATVAGAASLSPSVVRAASVCPPPPAAHVRCAAEVLRLRRGGRLVRPPIPRARSHGRLPARGLRPAVSLDSNAAAASPAGLSPPGAYTAAYLQQAYDLSYLSATGGSSDTVAVVDAYDDPSAEADLATFRAANGLPPCTSADGCLRKVNEAGASAPLPAANSSWAIEEATDLAAVSSLCPNCHLLLVEASSTMWSDLLTAMQTAAQLGANQISDSWTTLDNSQPPGQLTFPDVAVIAASGDSGYVASGALFPAAAAGVTAVGGTTLQPAATVGDPRGFTETAWSGAGSGCAGDVAKPAFQSEIGCAGRAYADVSADADPSTGLAVYQSGAGGWLLAGGTSLSAPLVAAFEAVTGVDGTTPAWAYADSAQLNDPLAGSNGTCDPTLAALCTAGPGWDGPTGAGSISGQVIAGAPGIGAGTSGGAGYAQSTGADIAALLGGVYPNGLDTSVWWQYGTSSAYGEATAPVDIGSGSAIVSVDGQLTGLRPSTTYHYRLVAQNGDGISYGYDYTLATTSASQGPSQAPGDSSTSNGTAGSKGAAAPNGAGAASAGRPSRKPRLRLRGRPAVHRPLRATASGLGAGSRVVAFRWQIRRSGRWLPISGARSARLLPSQSDVGHRLRALATYTVRGGERTATSAPSAPVLPA